MGTSPAGLARAAADQSQFPCRSCVEMARHRLRQNRHAAKMGGVQEGTGRRAANSRRLFNRQSLSRIFFVYAKSRARPGLVEERLRTSLRGSDQDRTGLLQLLL